MSSSLLPSPVSPPSQETFERVFNLQRRVEPDHENHITSSFSVLDINNNDNNNTLALGSSSSKNYTSRRSKKLLGKTRTRNTTTAKSDSASVYNRNMPPTPTRSRRNLVHNLALPGPSSSTTATTTTTPQENYPLARNSTAILSNSRAKNQLPDNFSRPSIPKRSSSIYFHSLLQPIYVPVIHGPEIRRSYHYHHQQENRHP